MAMCKSLPNHSSESSGLIQLSVNARTGIHSRRGSLSDVVEQHASQSMRGASLAPLFE